MEVGSLKPSSGCLKTFPALCPRGNFEAGSWGHPGIDWGSAMQWLGWAPGLNLSFGT